MAAAIISGRLESEPAELLPMKISIQGYVYMARNGRRGKIGYTMSPSRLTVVVHSIETDDPAGIEAYWHRRFNAKRVRDTEFFTLDAGDVAAFRRRKFE